jgi:hypothetical protein
VEREDGGGAHDGPDPEVDEAAAGFAVELEEGVAGRDVGVAAVSLAQPVDAALTISVQSLSFISASCLGQLRQTGITPS